MAERRSDGLRFGRLAYDATILVSIVAIAYYAGRLAQRIDGMSTRGGVPISMEADSRLKELESRETEQDRRITNVEVLVTRCEPRKEVAKE